MRSKRPQSKFSKPFSITDEDSNMSVLKQQMERIATDKLRMVVVKVMRGIHTLYLELEPNWKN